MSNYSKRKQAEAEQRQQDVKKAGITVLVIAAVIALVWGGIYYLQNRNTNNSASASGDGDYAGDPDYDVFDYVTLGEYEGVEAYYVTPEVTDDDIEAEIETLLKDNIEYSDIDRELQSGDTVNIDFAGTVDGESFDGGSSSGYEYVLGEGSMIEGFDEGIYGHKVGETFTIDVTFPEDYEEESLQGKAAQFEITINEAQEVTYTPEWNDEFIDRYTEGEYSTTDEYRQVIYDYLLEDKTSESKDQLENDVFQAIFDNCTIDGYPEYLYNKIYDECNTQISYYASIFGIDTDTYLMYFAGGVTMEEYVIQNVNSALVTEALRKQLAIEISDEEYQANLERDYADYECESAEAFEETYGKDAILDYYESLKLYTTLVDMANVTEVTAEEYEALTAEEEEATEEDASNEDENSESEDSTDGN